MTDQNIVISESVLKRYDIKLRDWVFDNINDAKTTSITKKFTILTSEWSRDKATKDIEISEDYDILVSLPVGEQYIDNSIEAAASGITVIGHDGTNLIIKYLNRKPTTDIILQVTARKQGIALDVDGNIDLTDYAKKTDLPDISALATKEELNDKVDNYYTKAEVDDSFSQLDGEYVKSDDTALVKLVNDNEINLQEDHYNAWFGYRGGKVTNWKFGDGTEGGLADIYVKDVYLNDQKLSDLLSNKASTDNVYTKTEVDTKVSDLVNSAPETLDTLNELASALGNDPNFATTVANQIGTKANDDDVVHKTGDETINGVKTFTNININGYEITVD